MDPIGCATLLKDELVKVSLGAICDIEQDACHADHLLGAVALDIYGAAREVIAPLRSPTFPIDFLRAETAGDDNGNIIVLIAIERILAIAEIFQPILADILQVLDRHMTRDISIQRVIARLTKLSHPGMANTQPLILPLNT